MRKYLLPKDGQFYKANLHCHSNYSDGTLEPEEIKRQYMEKGYSIVAYTDHNVLIAHPELKDENFLPLNGYEIDVGEKKDENNANKLRKCCHLCFIALEEDNLTQVCWHRGGKYLFGGAPAHQDEVKFDESLPDFVREYSAQGVNEMIRRAKEGGFFVTYNHPTWSCEDYSNYINYEGMDAMEIVNYACQTEGYAEYNSRVYDDMLRAGKRIYAVAADDNHNRKAADHPNYDSFGGFVMIKADKLEYRTITKSLESGDFYASEGPKINELWYEDGKIHIECDNAKIIDFSCGIRKAKSFRPENGGYITSAEYEIPENAVYVRVTVTDENGLHANTRAYFTDEL